MKIGKLLSPATIALFALCGSAHANVAKLAGHWEGSGARYSLQGDHQGNYQVQFDNHLNAQGALDSTVEVKVPGMPVMRFSQVFRDTPKGFSLVSDQGSGGGFCMGEGLCEAYEGDSHGTGMAFTIIWDGPNSFRLIKTELKNYKAVRLYREKYTRVSTR